MSTRRLVMLITFLAVFAMAARISVDTDTWWHLRAGQWILEHRSIPQVDSFSYTRAGEPWQYPGWLVEAPMYLLYKVGGPGALNLWTAGMITLAFVFVWFTLSGGPFLRAFVIVLAATVSGVYWAARPYLVTFLLAAVFLWILEDFRWRKVDRLWWLPVLMVVWVNSHGGFVVGILLWGVYIAEALIFWLYARFTHGDTVASFRKVPGRLLTIGVFLLVAVLINPSGGLMFLYASKTIGIGALQEYIQEWQSPDFHSLQVQPFVWLLLLAIGVIGASRKRLALSDYLLFSGFAYMGLMAGRNVALFALAAPVVLTRYAAPLLESLGRKHGYRGLAEQKPLGRSQYLNWLLLILVLLAVAMKSFLVFPAKVNEEVFRGTMPVSAVEYLRTVKPEGRLFNTYNWGGYLLWALPEYPVFIDGRTDLYSDEVINQWLQVMRAEPGWKQVLEDYEINLILVERESFLDRILAHDSSWISVYEDDQAVIFERR
jgi:hypothetical protein